MAIQKKTLEKYKEIETLLNLGYTNNEIKEHLSKKYNNHPRHIERLIYNYKKQKLALTDKTNVIIHKDKKIRIGEENCYFCGTNKELVEHHISYNPQIVVTLCHSCHSKFHYIFKKYHEIILKKDITLYRISQHLKKIKKDIDF